MPNSRRVVLVAYPGAQVLDVTGPAAVFSGANRASDRRLYDVIVASSAGGAIRTSGDISIETLRTRDVPARGIDTLLVVGGDDRAVRSALEDAALERFVVRAVRSARRWGSVCSGTFLLARYRLLDGKRVATHWDGVEALARLHPELHVDPDALYVVDGPTWTSAGVTTGIDMALAMVEADLGASIASEVAQRLVLYGRRPGFQSQFSPLLRAQAASGAPFANLVDWIQSHLDERLDVETLAGRVGQSPRDFHRKFVKTMGKTPARFVLELRLDRARSLLPHSRSLKEIAAESGFSTAVHMTRAFERRFGVKPSFFRELQRQEQTSGVAGSGPLT